MEEQNTETSTAKTNKNSILKKIPPKRRTIKLRGGHAVSVTDTPRYFKGHRTREKYTQGFSHSFKSEFGDKIIQDPFIPTIRRYGDRSSISKMKIAKHRVWKELYRQVCPKRRLPQEIIDFIVDLLPKYDLSPSEEAHGRFLAKKCLWYENDLKKSGIDDGQKIESCKRIIEYHFFLTSLYGKQPNIPRPSNLLKILDESGSLDKDKMYQEIIASFPLNADSRNFSQESSFKRLSPKFDRFITYIINTQYSQESSNPELRNKGVELLDEAITKYGLNENNLDTYLKLTLQHIEWGLKKGYEEIIRNKQTQLMQNEPSIALEQRIEEVAVR